MHNETWKWVFKNITLLNCCDRLAKYILHLYHLVCQLQTLWANDKIGPWQPYRFSCMCDITFTTCSKKVLQVLMCQRTFILYDDVCERRNQGPFVVLLAYLILCSADDEHNMRNTLPFCWRAALATRSVGESYPSAWLLVANGPLLITALGTVGQKTAPMFAHFGKIGMVWNNDITKRSEIITWHTMTC